MLNDQLKKIVIKRKYVYLTYYGSSKSIIKIPKKDANLRISVDLPEILKGAFGGKI